MYIKTAGYINRIGHSLVYLLVCMCVYVFGVYCKGLDIFAEQIIHHILRQQRLQLVDVTL